MKHPDTAALANAIQKTHGGLATHLRTEQVYEQAPTGETVWHGPVDVFELRGHPAATVAYAWFESGKYRTVLGVGAVDCARRAVHAWILAGCP